jgi:hypothetical protein
MIELIRSPYAATRTPDWVVSPERGGQRYFADSKHPTYRGTVRIDAGVPYDYAKYRGREIVAFRELESFARRTKTLPQSSAARQAPERTRSSEKFLYAISPAVLIIGLCSGTAIYFCPTIFPMTATATSSSTAEILRRVLPVQTLPARARGLAARPT